MRKISLLLVLVMMLVALVSCDKGGTNPPESTGTKAPEVTTAANMDTSEQPTEEVTEGETKAPETPQDKWTQRY